MPGLTGCSIGCRPVDRMPMLNRCGIDTGLTVRSDSDKIRELKPRQQVGKHQGRPCAERMVTIMRSNLNRNGGKQLLFAGFAVLWTLCPGASASAQAVHWAFKPPIRPSIPTVKNAA